MGAIRQSRIRSFFAITLLIAAGFVPLASAGESPSWCAYMDPAGSAKGASEPLLPRQARYEVDLLGNLAHGSLSLEFANLGEVGLQLKFLARSIPGIQLTDLGVASDDAVRSQPLKYELAGSKERSKNPGRSRATSSDVAQGFSSDELSLGAEESVWIRVGFTQNLRFKDGSFRLRLPTLADFCAAGSAAEGSIVPLSVTLQVYHDEPLEHAESASHAVLVEFEGDRTVVETVAPDSGGQDPFEFEYALGRMNEPALSSFVTPENEKGERDVLLVFAPSIAPAEESVRLKELLFVLDTSGSMNGPKLDSAKGALAACLEQLNGADRFNLVEFDGSFTTLFEEPQEASVEALSESVAWLQTQQSGGSTTLLPALDATLKQSRGTEHHRLVVVLTDGAIGDEGKVLQFLQEHLDEARLFFVGVGAEPNRDKVRRLAEFARGTAVFADDPESLSAAVQELFAAISAPLAWDLRVDWGEAEVLAIEPQRMPDLFSGRPVTVKARVKGELPPTLVLEAATTGGIRTFEAVLPAGGAREYPQVPGVRPRSTPASKKKSGN